MTLEAHSLKLYSFSAAATYKPIDGLSLRVTSGQWLTIVGPTSPGLNLLGACLARLEPPGVRLVEGRLSMLELPEEAGTEQIDLFRLPSRGRRLRQVRREWLGYVSGAGALSPVRNVGVQLREALAWRPTGRRGSVADQLETVLAELGVVFPNRFLRAFPHDLSPVERQLAGLCLGLLGDPPLLIADHPVRNGGERLRHRLLAALERRREAGATVILITTALPEAAAGTHVAVLHAGRIVEEAPARQILGDPWHPLTAALIRSTREGGGLAGIDPDPLERRPGCAFAGRCPRARDGVCTAGRAPALAMVAGRRVACLLHHEQRE